MIIILFTNIEHNSSHRIVSTGNLRKRALIWLARECIAIHFQPIKPTHCWNLIFSTCCCTTLLNFLSNFFLYLFLFSFFILLSFFLFILLSFFLFSYCFLLTELPSFLFFSFFECVFLSFCFIFSYFFPLLRIFNLKPSLFLVHFLFPKKGGNIVFELFFPFCLSLLLSHFFGDSFHSSLLSTFLPSYLHDIPQ